MFQVLSDLIKIGTAKGTGCELLQLPAFRV
jgi:hypothetical protein